MEKEVGEFQEQVMKLKCIRYRDGRRRDSFLIEKEVGEIQEQVMKMNCIPYGERIWRDSGAGNEDELYSL